MAQDTHERFLAPHKLERSDVRVKARCPFRWQGTETFLRSPVIKLLTTEVKHLALRQLEEGLETQDDLSQAFTECHPGDALGRTTILAQIRSPDTPTSANGALTTLRKWVDLHDRARKLGVA